MVCVEYTVMAGIDLSDEWHTQSQRYVGKVIQPEVVPHVQGDGLIFQ